MRLRREHRSIVVTASPVGPSGVSGPVDGRSGAEIRALCDAATPGPWFVASREGDDEGWWIWADPGEPFSVDPFTVALLAYDGPDGGQASHDEREEADAAFIAAARGLVPALLAEVEAAHRFEQSAAGESAGLANRLNEVAAERDALRAEVERLRAGPLTFAELSAKSQSRRDRWHTPDTEPWTGADWSNAMCGEAGEAANVVKKIRRHETGMADKIPMDELVPMLADELGDVVAYCDLLARHYGIDLGVAVARKFNFISEREGFPERLGAES